MIIRTGISTCSTSRMNTCSAASSSASPVTAIASTIHSGTATSSPSKRTGSPNAASADEHREVARELQRERGRDRRIDDELVRKRDLADEPRVAGEAHRRALQAFLRREPRPQRDGDEQQEARAVEAPGAEHRREHEMVDARAARADAAAPTRDPWRCRDSAS